MDISGKTKEEKVIFFGVIIIIILIFMNLAAFLNPFKSSNTSSNLVQVTKPKSSIFEQTIILGNKSVNITELENQTFAALNANALLVYEESLSVLKEENLSFSINKNSIIFINKSNSTININLNGFWGILKIEGSNNTINMLNGYYTVENINTSNLISTNSTRLYAANYS